MIPKTKNFIQKSGAPVVLMLMSASWSETISKQRNSPLPLSSSQLAHKLTYQSSSASC